MTGYSGKFQEVCVVWLYATFVWHNYMDVVGCGLWIEEGSINGEEFSFAAGICNF